MMSKTSFLVIIISFAIGILQFPVSKRLFVCLLDGLLNVGSDYTNYNENYNIYLTGNHAPVSEENYNVPLENLFGTIPESFSGLFLQVGPNPIPQHIGKKRYHAFDGHGMIHSIRFFKGYAWYSNQWIHTPRYLTDRKFGRTILPFAGELKGFLGLFKAIVWNPVKTYLVGIKKFHDTQANTAILFYNGNIYACHEGGFPFSIQWSETGRFESLGYETFGNQLNHPFTAHSKVDHENKKLYFSGYDFGCDKNHCLKYGSIDNSSLEAYFQVDSPEPSFSHDMFVTKHHTILVENSVVFSPEGLQKGEFLKFNADHRIRFAVIPKNATSNTETVWFSGDKPLFLSHGANSWEEINEDKKEIVMWAPLSQSFDASFESDKINSHHMSEIRLDLIHGNTTIKTFDVKYNVEFPRVHPRFVGRNSRYIYAAILQEKGILFSGFVKFDTLKRKVDSAIHFEKGIFCREVVPIPKSESSSKSSDDVFIGAFLWNSPRNITEWVLYDGKTMNYIPVIRMMIPNRVPFGFHGEWIDESSLQQHLAPKF